MIIKIGNKPYELATKEEVMEAVMEYLREAFYPIGSIYISINKDFNPNNKFYGTWELIETGRYLRATEIKNNVGNPVDAGAPEIEGYFNANTDDGPNWWGGSFYLDESKGTTGSNGNGVGGVLGFKASLSSPIYGNSVTITPESIDCFMWKRIS